MQSDRIWSWSQLKLFLCEAWSFCLANCRRLSLLGINRVELMSAPWTIEMWSEFFIALQSSYSLLYSVIFLQYSHCLKLIQNVVFDFSTNFCPFKTDFSANTIWPKSSGFQKFAKMDRFWYFLLSFVHSKCNRSSLRSQCGRRLFLWFSNNVTWYLGPNVSKHSSRRNSVL